VLGVGNATGEKDFSLIDIFSTTLKVSANYCFALFDTF
jgi:hypothetical protein